jgi:hypothetical protein
VKVLAVVAVGVGVGAVVGAVVGVLGVDPVLEALPHALTPIISTRPMTAKKVSFGNTLMNALLHKNVLAR